MADERLFLSARARAFAALGDPGRLAIVDALALGDASPGELARALHLPTNLLAHHVAVLQSAGLVTRSRSEGDRRRTYLRLRPDALPAAPTPALPPAPRVVFVCTHNSARSRLAAALWTRRSRVPATSAGTEPAAQVHPRAVRVAERHGIPLDRTRPVPVARVVDERDLVVAVCDSAHERLGNGPAAEPDTGDPGRPRVHWSVPDPARVDTDEAFETAYADLADRVDRLAPILTQGAEP